jgi:hypothetical protein
MARACSHFKEHGPCTLMLIPSHACTFSCVSQWSEKEMESVVPHMVPVRAPGTGENEHARAIQNVNISLVTQTSSVRVDRTSRAFNRRFPISPHPRSSDPPRRPLSAICLPARPTPIQRSTCTSSTDAGRRAECGVPTEPRACSPGTLDRVGD